MCIFVVVLIIGFITNLRFPRKESIASIIARQQFRAFEKYDFKVKKIQLDLNFLSSYKFYAIIPHFLNFKLANSRLRSSMMYDSCRRRLLSVEIANKKNHLKKLEKNTWPSYTTFRKLYHGLILIIYFPLLILIMPSL